MYYFGDQLFYLQNKIVLYSLNAVSAFLFLKLKNNNKATVKYA